MEGMTVWGCRAYVLGLSGSSTHEVQDAQGHFGAEGLGSLPRSLGAT